MTRSAPSLLIRPWATSATADTTTPETVGLVRADGWPSTYSPPGTLAPRREVFNEMFSELYALGDDVNRNGALLPWSDQLNYYEHARVLGSDGLVYRAVVATGPATSNAVDPATKTNSNVWADGVNPNTENRIRQVGWVANQAAGGGSESITAAGNTVVETSANMTTVSMTFDRANVNVLIWVCVPSIIRLNDSRLQQVQPHLTTFADSNSIQTLIFGNRTSFTSTANSDDMHVASSSVVYRTGAIGVYTFTSKIGVTAPNNSVGSISVSWGNAAGPRNPNPATMIVMELED